MDEILDIPSAYSKTLVELGHAYDNLIVLDADISDSCQTEGFYSVFPERAFDLGIAEQSLPTFAAGLHSGRKDPFLQYLRGIRGTSRIGYDTTIGVL